MGFFDDVGHAFEHGAGQVGDAFKGGGHKAGNAFGQIGTGVDDIVDRIEDQADEAVHAVERAATKAVRQVERAGSRGAQAVAELAPELAEKVLAEIQEGLEQLLTMGTLDKVLRLAEHAVPGKKSWRISFLEFKVDVRDKIHVIRDLVHSLPTNRREIINMVHALVDDDEVVIHIDARLISSTAGFDIPIPIPVEVLVDKADEIFGSFGL